MAPTPPSNESRSPVKMSPIKPSSSNTSIPERPSICTTPVTLTPRTSGETDRSVIGTIANVRKDTYKKDPSQRIFVGRSLRLEKIKFFGFDMDYTLVNYKSPAYETLMFQHTIERLINIGYPDDLRSFQYDPNFPVRGLWFDKLYGNLIKVDGFGNILVGTHGTRSMKPQEIEEFYPNKFLKLIDNRVIVLNTLFNLPDMYLLAKLVDYFDALPNYKKTADKSGVRSGDVVMSYKAIAQDVLSAVNFVHRSGGMKDYVLAHIDTYVHKADDMRSMLLQLRSAGAQTFLLTNSEYKYTNGLMTHLAGADWSQLFDIAIVDAKKPDWFSESTVFRQVDTVTGTHKVGMHAGPLKRGHIYAGGSCDALRRLMKFRGKDTLYVGDHIFGDVLRSKKSRGWRTFLVVPELNHELSIWTERHVLFETLAQLDMQLGKIYKNLDFKSTNTSQVEIADAVKAIRKVTHEMDQSYGALGSLFRSGTRTTFFATQVERYADLYSSSCYNLVHYPKFYFFRAPMMLLPHESTVDHLAKVKPDMRKTTQVITARQPALCHEDIEDDVVSDDKNNNSEVFAADQGTKDYVQKGAEKSGGS
uniref:Cytosolic purine 5'-nucleotidase n=1 Tax=Panagrellus redivivus TaxID=6233 RepID=A0A7E4VNK2_PANRE